MSTYLKVVFWANAALAVFAYGCSIYFSNTNMLLYGTINLLSAAIAYLLWHAWCGDNNKNDIQYMDSENGQSNMLDNVIKFSKAMILLSIALFMMRCTFGSFMPDVHVTGLENLEQIEIEVDESEDGDNIKIITIRKED